MKAKIVIEISEGSISVSYDDSENNFHSSKPYEFSDVVTMVDIYRAAMNIFRGPLKCTDKEKELEK